MALVLPRTKQLPTQQLKGYTDVLNRIMTSTKEELEAGYQSVVRKEDASIGNIKPVGAFLKRELDPEAPSAVNMRIGVSGKAESIGLGSLIRMGDTKEDFFKKLDGDMYKYRLVPNGEMVDAWHEHKADRFGKDKNTTKRIFIERQTNQFTNSIPGDAGIVDRYEDEDSYEPVTARPAMGLPVTEEEDTRYKDMTARRRAGQAAMRRAGIDDDVRFDRFLDTIVGSSAAETRRTVAQDAAREARTGEQRAKRLDAKVAKLRKAADKRPSDGMISNNVWNLDRDLMVSSRRHDAFQQLRDIGRRALDSGGGGVEEHKSPEAHELLRQRQRQSDALLESLDDQLARLSVPANTPVSSPALPQTRYLEALGSAARRVEGLNEGLKQTMEAKGLTPKKTPAASASKTPTKTPKKVLFQTPETGGGGGETRGAAEQTPGRMINVTRVLTLIDNIQDSDSLETLHDAFIHNDLDKAKTVKGISDKLAATVTSRNRDERMMIFKAIEDRKASLFRQTKRAVASKSGGAAPNKEHLIDEILTRKITHHSTGQPYTHEELKTKNVRSLQSILSRK